MFHISWILSGLSTGTLVAYGWYRLRAWRVEAKMARLLPLEQLLVREARKTAPPVTFKLEQQCGFIDESGYGQPCRLPVGHD